MEIFKEFLKLVISTLVFPIMVILLIFITFIAAHEAFWKSLSKPIETEQ